MFWSISFPAGLRIAARGLNYLLVLGVSLALPAASAQMEPRSANEFVRQAVANELRAMDEPGQLFRYTHTRESKSGIAVRDMVETGEMIVARTLKWNGRELTPKERKEEDRRLARLLASREERREKAEEQQEERQRVLRLMRALPEALEYEYDGTALVGGHRAVRLKFRPKPGFKPEKETYLYKAAEGHLWVEPNAMRLLRLQARLREDVNIGWGLLGRIDEGSSIHIEQRPVAEDAWRITEMKVRGSGRAFVFKKIRIHSIQHAENFRPVRPMSIESALELLRSNAAPAEEARFSLR